MYRAKEKQMSIYDYLPPYHGELRDKNRWVRLAKAAISARIALGCRVIQLHYEVSDREVVQLVRESPYLQYFLGMETFSDEMPFSARTVARFRARIPDKVVRPAVRLLRSFV